MAAGCSFLYSGPIGGSLTPRQWHCFDSTFHQLQENGNLGPLTAILNCGSLRRKPSVLFRCGARAPGTPANRRSVKSRAQSCV